MASKNKTIQFWYEFASPYTFLSMLRILDLSSRFDFVIDYRPFLLGSIFKKRGLSASPFKLYPHKRDYMWQDIARIAKDRKIVFNKPSINPRNSFWAARVALYGREKHWCHDFSLSVFKAHFVYDQEIGDKKIIADLLESLALPSRDILAEASLLSNKESLRQQNNLADDLGIFGSPSFIVDQNLFWGDDRLEMALQSIV